MLKTVWTGSRGLLVSLADSESTASVAFAAWLAMSSGGLGDHSVLRVDWIMRRLGRGRYREVAIERL
jgi:hypothetical protein